MGKRIIWFIAIIIFGILVVSCRADQEIKGKLGYLQVECEGISASPVVGLSYELKNKFVGLEGELEGFILELEQVNTLYCASVSLIPKIYFGNFYAGFKGGYIFNYIQDDMDADDEVSRGGVLGFKFGDYFIEGQVNIADLDVETRLPYEPEIEKKSRLNNFQILIGKKF